MILTVTLNPSLDEWMRLDSLRVGALNRASAVTRYPGGKGINVARVVRELGGRTRALAFAGGEDGAILEGLVSRLGIPHTFMPLVGSTRNNYKIRTAQPLGLTEINTTGPRVSASDLRRMTQRLLARTPAPACVVLSGSLPPGAPASVYRRWIAALKRRRIPAVLDTSGAALREGLAAAPWLIKPNRQEAEELLRCRLGDVEHIARAARRLLARGPEVVIISLGADGALLACAASPGPGTWLASPPLVLADSAVGAGDALVGGFVTGWSRRLGVLEAFRLGVACGTASAMTPGTELCHRAEVRRLLRRVTLQRLRLI